LYLPKNNEWSEYIFGVCPHGCNRFALEQTGSTETALLFVFNRFALEQTGSTETALLFVFNRFALEQTGSTPQRITQCQIWFTLRALGVVMK